MDVEYLTKLFGLVGRVAMVTGARHGIGAAVAIALSRLGARVAVTSRDIDGLAPVVESIRAIGGEALPLAMELTDRRSITDAVERTRRAFGRIDILVNNAALAIRGDSLTFQEADWDLVFDTNVKGMFFTCQEVARVMIGQGGGRIINMSSVFARAALPQRAAYGSSKAAVDQLTRMLAVEWAGYGILVNSIAPTTVITPSRAKLLQDPQWVAERTRRIPLGRLATPEDVVGAVVFLASPAAGFITRHTIMVDGGYICM